MMQRLKSKLPLHAEAQRCAFLEHHLRDLCSSWLGAFAPEDGLQLCNEPLVRTASESKRIFLGDDLRRE